MSLTLAQDFRLTSSTPTQTVTAGQTTGPYNLTIQPVGSSFNAAVTLACISGLPAQAQCIFSPSGSITPGSSAVDVVMSISTESECVEIALATRFVVVRPRPDCVFQFPASSRAKTQPAFIYRKRFSDTFAFIHVVLRRRQHRVDRKWDGDQSRNLSSHSDRYLSRNNARRGTEHNRHSRRRLDHCVATFY